MRIIAKIAASAYGQGSSRIAQFERNTGQRFTSNINVLLQVSVEYHEFHGLKLTLIDIDPNFTLGALEQQRRATLERLVAENPDHVSRVGERYISSNQRLKLPAVLQRIALVSSKTSAGREDFMHTLQSNAFGYQFRVDDYHSSVQGDNNVQDLRRVLVSVFTSGNSYDAVVIVRGGGAQTDLLMFENYAIAQVVARLPIPVITGIGHHRNETVTDLMANTQTKTPTQAAEFIINRNRTYEDAVLKLQQSVLIKAQQIFADRFKQLSSINAAITGNVRTLITRHTNTLVAANQVSINKSKSILFNNRNNLNNLSSQLISRPRVILYNRLTDINKTLEQFKTGSTVFLRTQQRQLNHYVSVIKLMAPNNILKKGFAIVRHNNKIISTTEKIQSGSEIEVILDKINILSTVKQKTNYDGSDFNL